MHGTTGGDTLSVDIVCCITLGDNVSSITGSTNRYPHLLLSFKNAEFDRFAGKDIKSVLGARVEQLWFAGVLHCC